MSEEIFAGGFAETNGRGADPTDVIFGSEGVEEHYAMDGVDGSVESSAVDGVVVIPGVAVEGEPDADVAEVSGDVFGTGAGSAVGGVEVDAEAGEAGGPIFGGGEAEVGSGVGSLRIFLCGRLGGHVGAENRTLLNQKLAKFRLKRISSYGFLLG